MGAGLTGVLAGEVQDAAARATADPRRAARELGRLIPLARGAGDAETVVVAERAMGLARRELADPAGAARHFRRAITVAHEAGLSAREAEARASLALDLLRAGRSRAALAELERAVRAHDDPGSGVVQAQFAIVYARLGRFDEALAHADLAVATTRRSGDRSFAAGVLGNRGLIRTYRGELVQAERDLRRAVELSIEAGDVLRAYDRRHNLGFLLARRGDLPAALAAYDEAEAGLASLGVPLAGPRLDRAEALLSAGLAADALAVATAAAAELSAAGLTGELGEAQLLAARAALAAGRPDLAEPGAASAQRLLGRQQRAPWTALARSVRLRASVARGVVASGPLLRSAVELSGHGFPDEAAELHLLAARAARGQRRTELLTELACGVRARTAGARLAAWHARVLLRDEAGSPAEALRAARSGLRVVQEQRQLLGAAELRTATTPAAVDLSATTLAVALRTGDPARVLAWSEHLRATALQRPPVRPPADGPLAAALDQLRTAALQLDEARVGGEPLAPLVARQAQLEREVRRIAHRTPGLRTEQPAPPSLAQVRDLLGDRALLDLVLSGDRLHALVVDRSGARLLPGPSLGAVATELRHLRHALRLAVQRGGRDDELGVSAARLAALVLPPGLSAERLVVVPAGPLHAAPWALLPELRGREVEVAPSLGLWARPARASTGGVVTVAGPGLAAAEQEARDVAARRDGTPLTGGAATVEAVLSALDGAATAHLACHGRFRADNAMFSALLLADGPLTVYDLERLQRAPELVVLSACDSGRSTVTAGQELLGLAAALFALGTRTLIASVVPVDDAAAARVMTGLHERLAAGASPAAALAAVQGAGDARTAASFVCLTAAAG